MLRIILSENFENLWSENRLRYSNQFFTQMFIEKIRTKRQIFATNFRRAKNEAKIKISEKFLYMLHHEKDAMINICYE
jgi:hypothetical protein